MNDAQRDELIVRIDERVLAIQGILEVGDKRLNDHSRRLQILEKWRSALAAVVATILAGIAIALRLR
jgi:anti-sigma-K factor RskA